MNSKFDDNSTDQADALSDDEEIIFVSKTQLKKDSLDIQKLGEDLISLDKQNFNSLGLPENVAAAIDAARKMKKDGARKRQVQYIGKLLRKIDVEPVREEFERIKHNLGKETREFHRLEKWRDRLLADGDAALSDLLNEYPQADRQHLRQLMRQANKEKKLEKPPKSAREIFQYLKSLI